RRVVGAGEFAFRALRLLAVCLAGKTKGPGGRVHIENGVEFQQALVDRPKLLSTHVAIVDAGKACRGAKIGQRADCFQEPLVADAPCFQARTLLGSEEPAQGWQIQRRLTACEHTKDDLQALPQIVVPIVMTALSCALAQPCEAIALCVNGALFVADPRPVQQIALLSGKQKQEPINKTQELLKVALGTQTSVR